MFFLSARGMQAVDQDIGVMHDAFFPGANFDGANPARGLEIGGENEVPVAVGAAGGKLVGLARTKDDVGLAELPSGSELGGRGEVAGVSFGQAFVGPGLKKSDLLVRETKFAGEFQVGGSGKPRRHA